jgi:hypothetical protein
LTSNATSGNQWFLNGTAIAGAINPMLTISETGIYTVQATVDNCSSLTSDEMVVEPHDQTISFAAIPAKTVGDPVFQISATTTSGLPAAFSTSSNKINISGTSVTIVSAGSVTIQADQSGNLFYKAAPTIPQTFCINPAKPTITSIEVNNATTSLSSNTTDGNQWFFNGNAIAGATNQTLTLNRAGVYTVQATVDNCLSLISDEKVVEPHDQTISFTTIPPKTVGDPVFQISATTTSGLPVAFSTSSNKINISGTTATIVNAGSVTIQADQPGNSYFKAAATVPQTFCINPAKPTITLTEANSATPTLSSSATAGNQWFLNGNAITGATNQTLTVSTTGSYTVQVSADVCISKSSDVQAMAITEVSTLTSKETGISLFPNPANGSISISLENLVSEQLVNIQLYDMLGQSIKEILSEGGNVVILDLSNYAQGTYIIRALQSGRLYHGKFYKK